MLPCRQINSLLRNIPSQHPWLLMLDQSRRTSQIPNWCLLSSCRASRKSGDKMLGCCSSNPANEFLAHYCKSLMWALLHESQWLLLKPLMGQNKETNRNNAWCQHNRQVYNMQRNRFVTTAQPKPGWKIQILEMPTVETLMKHNSTYSNLQVHV